MPAVERISKKSMMGKFFAQGAKSPWIPIIVLASFMSLSPVHGAAMAGEKEARTGKDVLSNEPRMEVRVVQVRVGNLRKGPSLKSPVIGKVSKGEKVEAIRGRAGWYKVRTAEGLSGWAHRSLFVPASAKEKNKGAPAQRINAILVKESEKSEKVRQRVLFYLTGFQPPEMFAIEGEHPRIVCDFFGLVLDRKLESEKDYPGPLVRSIRVAEHKTPLQKVRIVIDLTKGKNYDVEQFFYKQENLYSLIITAE